MARTPIPRRRIRPVTSGRAAQRALAATGGLSPATIDRMDTAIDNSAITGLPIQDMSIADEDYDPRAIDENLDALGMSPELRQEYRFKILLRMMLRQFPLRMMAQTLGCGIRTVQNLREALRAQIRKEAAERDLPSYVGMTDAFYNEIIGIALNEASAANAGPATKLSALKVALEAQRDRSTVYEKSGFFSALKLTPQTGFEDSRAEQADRLMNMSKEFVEAMNMTDDEWDAREEARRQDPEGGQVVVHSGHEVEDTSPGKIRVL